MATTGPAVPPPPPMPGTSGALVMPHWRDTYRPPIRESAPSKEQIEKQQYAHLPDKLLNTLSKDKKPFTYTPQGISGERGVLDMSEIRSPRMKKRLMANLHAGEEDTEDSSDERLSSASSKPVMNGQMKPNLYQQPVNPLVLPPLTGDHLKPRSPSPNFAQQQRKEVRFAPSPILVTSDDEELQNVLQKRRLDVEARAKIVTNEPVSSESTVAQQTHVQPAPESYNKFDVDQLVKNASETVQSARNIFGTQSTSPPQQVWDNNNNLVEQEEFHKEEACTRPKTIATETEDNQLENNIGKEVQISDEFEKPVERREEVVRAPPPPPPPPSAPWRQDLNNSNHRSAPGTFEVEPAPKMAVSAQRTHYNQGNFYNQMPPPLQQPRSTVNSQQSDILKHLFDDGLQDEIDKFEEISRETAMSPSMANYAPVRKPAPPPVPPKPQGFNHDGRTSCPPFVDHNNNLPDDNNFANSFRCISPSFEILKNLRAQNSGYNYVSKPRPFYRLNEQPEPMGYRPASQQHTFRPVETATSYEHFNGKSSERVVPIQNTHNYASLPRKIKLNTDLSISQPKSYDNKESGREFLNNCGMFSQLPPSDSADDSPTTPPTPSKMFYGLNPRQPNANVNHQVNNRNPLAQPKTYENPEAGREFLNSAGMFSQLPPPRADHYQQNTNAEYSTYGGAWRQTSLPPPPLTLSRNGTPVPMSATPPPPVNSMNAPKQPRLSMSQLRKIPPSERPPEPNPSKYTGSHIPSRSFRILQLITGEDIENQYSENKDDTRLYQAPPARPAHPPPPPPTNYNQTSPNYQQQSYMAPTLSTSDYGTDF